MFRRRHNVATEWRSKVAQLTTEEDLRRTMRELLLQFGGAKQVAIVLGLGTRAHKCFVELNSPEQTSAVKETFGGIDFGEIILISIPCFEAQSA
jgi:hypothetical protein